MLEEASKKALTAAALLLLLLYAYSIALAQTGGAVLYSSQGVVEAKLAAADWRVVAKGTALSAGDELRVDISGKAALLFSDGVLLRLGPGAHFKLKGNAQNPGLELQDGKFHFFNRGGDGTPPIDTPTVSAAVRGTEIAFDVSAKHTTVSVIDGQVECRNQSGVLVASRGEQIEATQSALRKVMLANPYDAVQWALYYPAVLDTAELNALSMSIDVWEREASASLKSALSALSAGRLSEALEELNIFENSPAARVRAVVSAQKAIIAVVQDKKDAARAALSAAQLTDENSAATLLAQAYVSQSEFNLKGAEDALLKLLTLVPEHPTALARLSELELGAGKIMEAHERLLLLLNGPAANDSYVQSLMGFALLFKNDSAGAAQQFETALGLDSGLALPHLGLGIVAIKNEDFEKGRTELEKAVLLEPSTAVYRSYLGKAFFENEDEDLAANEYELALGLDPKDPTPYLYRAFNRLSQNNVIGALEDIETSIKLNNNRAVYRSSLQLDRDLATRTVGLARIFQELGFSRAAEIEAIRSLNSDYRNYSAHLFLADSANNLLTPDWAFSERRIATLLAPLSYNLLNSIGGEASLNDYTSLFERNGARSGVGISYQSTPDLLALEGFTAGKSDTAAYTLGASNGLEFGAYHGEIVRDYRLNLGLQYQPHLEDRIILEARTRKRSTSFEEDDADQRLPFGLMLGYNRRLNADSSLLGSVSVDKDRNNYSVVNERDILVNVIQSGESEDIIDAGVVDEDYLDRLLRLRSEVQYIYSHEYFSIVGGADHLYVEPDRSEDSLIESDQRDWFTDAGYRLRSEAETRLQSGSGYLYSTIHLSSLADLDIGASYAAVEKEYREIPPFAPRTTEESRFNPKAGITAYPLPDLTFRAAYFETLQKALIEDQASIEPTSIGGFTQRIRNLSGSQARNSAVGVDYKTDSVVFAGAEFIHRNLSEPRVQAINGFSFDLDEGLEEPIMAVSPVEDRRVNQNLSRAYLYGVLSPQLAATFDYLYGVYDETDEDEPLKNRLNKAAAALRYFHDSGFFGWSQMVWRNQDRENLYLGDGASSFWTFDSGVGYRLPHRRGTLSLQFFNIGDRRFTYDQTFGFEPFVPDRFTVRLAAAFNF